MAGYGGVVRAQGPAKSVPLAAEKGTSTHGVGALKRRSRMGAGNSGGVQNDGERRCPQ